MEELLLKAMSINDLPTLNALLNLSSTLLLLGGFRAIRQGTPKVHKRFMLAAIGSSTLFLISYLTYHFQVGSKHFEGEGFIRVIYFLILISHTILATLIVPLVAVTVFRALRADFDRHKRIARWTFPFWLYVSLTGVLIYLMLYEL